MSTRRLIAVAGLLAVLLTLPAFTLVPPAPHVGMPADDIVSYYRAYQRPFLIYGWLLGLSVPFHLVHLAGVHRWAHSRGSGLLGNVYAAGAVTAHTTQLLLLAVFQMIAYSAVHLDAGTTRFASDLANIGFAFYPMVEIPRLVAGQLLIRRTRIVPTSLGWLAAVAALLCLLGSFGAFLFTGPLAPGRLLQAAWYPAFLVWFMLVNVALLRRSEAVDP